MGWIALSKTLLKKDEKNVIIHIQLNGDDIFCKPEVESSVIGSYRLVLRSN